MSRTRVWALGILLILYLLGVLLLSAVTLNEPRTGGAFNAKISRSGIFHYGAGTLGQPPYRSRIQWCSRLRFLDPPREPVALASFPGSGNTWLRYLLQQATGIHTGSVYKDYGLLKNGFPAESVMNGSVSVVKTHEYGPAARGPFRKAILLVRAPAAAIQAEFNRQSGGHIGFASFERYKRNRGRFWQHFVYEKLASWRQTNLDWLRNFTGPTHVIFYEQLVNSAENTLRGVMEFLHLKVSNDTFQCAISRKEGIYRRKRRAIAFDPFTPAMKMRVDGVQKQVYDEIYNVAMPTTRRTRR